jgi:hypothetical protein
MRLTLLRIRDIIENIRKFGRYAENQEVAAALGLLPQNLSRLKTKGPIPYERIHKWCEKEGISLDLIFGNPALRAAEVETPYGQIGGLLVSKPNEINLILDWRELEEEDRELLTAMMRRCLREKLEKAQARASPSN